MIADNIFNDIPLELNCELLTSIYRAKNLRIERIVSLGHCSPRDFWYDQDEDEWIIVLEGDASIQFANQPELVQLKPGSYLHIAAHVKHRVSHTNPTRHTIWLAVFFGD
jgi:cupin 2 domain-containing protein